MIDFAAIASLGPIVVIAFMLFSFVERVVWPFLVKQVWPSWSKRAKAEVEARRKAEAEQEQEQEREEQERRRREDRLFKVLEDNTRVMSGLQNTLERMSNQLAQQSEVIHGLALDVSGVYGYLQVPRPSKKRPAEEAPAAPAAAKP